jgi:hypothetical protein
MTHTIWPLENLFKRKMNEDHIRFILEKSNIHADVLKKMMHLCCDNAYHNYGHTLGVMRTIIEIAEAQGLDKKTTTKLCLAGGVHDANHPGISTASDELVSSLIMFERITDHDLALCGLSSADRPFISKAVMATTFAERGKIPDQAAYIIQDADLGYMGKGKYIYLLASIGLIDEFCRANFNTPDPVQFIRSQQKPFIDMVVNMSPSKDTFFLSEGAQKVLTDPRNVLDDVLLWPDAIYWLAYDLRKADVTLEEFTTTIDRQTSFH